MTSTPAPVRLPSGEQLEMSAGGYRAVVVGVGAGLRELSHDGRALVDGYAAEQICPGMRGAVLMPWPGRIEDGRYSHDGVEHQLPINEVPLQVALHGLVSWVPWQVAEHRADAVTLRLALPPQPGYEFSLDLEASYRLAADGLSVTFTATNTGAQRAPYGCGPHPYLRGGAGPMQTWELTLPAEQVLEFDDRLLPRQLHEVEGTRFDFRTGKAIGATVLDNAYTRLRRGPDGRCRARVVDPGDGHGVEVWCDDGFGWLQVYTSDTQPGEYFRRAVAIEPVTAPSNAFRTGDGLVLLAPGGRHTARWGVQAI